MAWQKRKKTALRYDCSVRTIQRYEDEGRKIREAAANEQEAALGFPASRLIGGNRYDNVEALAEWDTACATVGRGKLTSPNPATKRQAASVTKSPLDAKCAARGRVKLTSPATARTAARSTAEEIS